MMIVVQAISFMAIVWALCEIVYREGYRRGHHDGLGENFEDRRKKQEPAEPRRR